MGLDLPLPTLPIAPSHPCRLGTLWRMGYSWRMGRSARHGPYPSEARTRGWCRALGVVTDTRRLLAWGSDLPDPLCRHRFVDGSRAIVIFWGTSGEGR